MLRYSTLILLLGLGACYAAVIPNSIGDVLPRDANAVPRSLFPAFQDTDDLETSATAYHGYGHHHGYGDYGHGDYHHHHHHEPYHHHHHDPYHHHHHHGYNNYYGHDHHDHHDHHHHHGGLGFGVPGLFDVHLGK